MPDLSDGLRGRGRARPPPGREAGHALREPSAPRPRGFNRTHAIHLAILRWASRRYFGVAHEGFEQLPAGPFILAAAHYSLLDGPLIVAHVADAGRPIAPLMVQGMLRFPFTLVSPPWRPIGIERERAGGDVAALRATLEALRNYPVLVFPEGARRRGAVAIGHSGVGWLALRSGVPVLPAALLGAAAALPRGAHWPRRVPLALRIGPPIDLSAAAGGARSSERADLATTAIMAAIAAVEAKPALTSDRPS